MVNINPNLRAKRDSSLSLVIKAAIKAQIAQNQRGINNRLIN